MTSPALLLSFVLAATPAQWPGFLGQGAGPVAPESVPLKWSPSENIAWTRVLPGFGQSSPVVWGELVYLTSVEGDSKQTLHVVALQLDGGEVAWDRTFESTYPEKNSVYISRAAPTPLVDDKAVYAYFESGDVVACSHEGEPLWTRSLSNDYGHPTNEFGLSASPVQSDDRIVILIDDPAAAYLVALDKATGKPLWKTDRTPRSSWSSPALVTIDGKPQVVCSSDGSVDGYDLDNGERLWTDADVGGNTATTPLDMGAGRFLIAASPGRDGKNTDKARQSNGLMTAELKEGQWRPKWLWRTEGPTPSWASPVIYHGYAYWVNRSGVVYCLNAETGETAYTERIPQSAWATPVGVGERLYLFGKEGLTTVIADGPEFRVLAENELWTEDSPPANLTPTAEETSEERQRGVAMFAKPTLYGVAVVDGCILLRTGSQIYCVRR